MTGMTPLPPSPFLERKIDVVKPSCHGVFILHIRESAFTGDSGGMKDHVETWARK